jgi:nucleoside-diphosphate-sugar epimerase/glycosyltransferase involved in cell wall biosynthesis
MPILATYIRALEGPILVTGASGFIGANLYKEIAAVRRDVFAVVRQDKGWRLVDVHDDKVIAVDLNDANATKNLVDSVQPRTVFNCVAYGAYSFEEDADLIYRTNFLALSNLATELARYSLAALVHAGSSSEYGANCAAPSEDGLRDANSHYAVSKGAASDFLHYAGKHRGVPCVNLRLYSVYGPLEDTSRLIPNLLRQALAGHLPPLVDARTSRDFVHVTDVCRALITAALRMHPDIYGESFNIGSGKRTTIAELADKTRELFSITDEPVFGTMEGRNWDLADWYADASKALDVLGWQPEIALEDGLRQTSEWVKSLSDADMAVLTKKKLGARKRSVSAIIACYKDEPAIPIMYARLTEVFTKLGIDYEIIFVNDCSPDASADVIQSISASDPHVVGISHSRNFGSQMAFRSGMELCTKDSVVLLDGDLQDPPELIEHFYREWEQGWDVVYGRRVRREMPWFWGQMYKAFYRIFAAFSYVPMPHDAGDFSLMDRRVVGWLLNCPERDLFVRGLRAYVGFRQTGVDYVRPERMFGRSTNSLLKNIGWAKKGIFSFSDTPLTMLTAAGVVLLMLSVLAATVMVVLKVFRPDIAPRGATTMLVMTLFFGSLNLFAIGLVGEYVAKIMAEVKGRPRLIRSALIRHGKSTQLLPDGKSAEMAGR